LHRENGDKRQKRNDRRRGDRVDDRLEEGTSPAGRETATQERAGEVDANQSKGALTSVRTPKTKRRAPTPGQASEDANGHALIKAAVLVAGKKSERKTPGRSVLTLQRELRARPGR